VSEGGENAEQGTPRPSPVGVRPAVTRPELTVVVPSFNQAGTIQDNLREIARRLEARGLDFEMIVVSDGSSDDTHAEAAALDDDRVRALRYDRNLGKGYALRTGSAAANAEWVAWIDSDLDLDPARIERFLDTARRGDLDVVVGSKRHPESEVTYPTRRRVYSWLYQQLVRAMFSLDVRDTQVGMKLFRREVLDEVLPVVLVKRYAFDLEILAVAKSFGFDRIEEAPVSLDYRFGESGVNWRAIAQALWDTGAIFYRLRLLRFYERRRLLARRVAANRPGHLASLTVVVVAGSSPEVAGPAARRVRDGSPEGTRVVILTTRDPSEPGAPIAGADVVNAGPGPRHERLAAVMPSITTEVVAILDEDSRPRDDWAQAALALLGDPTVGAVVGPAVPTLGGPPARDAAGILTESRIGVGGARVRHHVGHLREVGDFPLTNVFARTWALQRAIERGQDLGDGLCAALRRHQGLAVLCSPDVVVATDPPGLREYLTRLHGLGRLRGAQIAGGRPPRLRHLLPAMLLPLAALGPAALLRGGRLGRAWAIAAGLYAASVAGFAAVVLVLHRRPRVVGYAAAGAVASHAAFGAGLLRGLGGRILARARRRR
jgi:glycosyltransferase involved in cell wall biosynthesis